MANDDSLLISISWYVTVISCSPPIKTWNRSNSLYIVSSHIKISTISKCQLHVQYSFISVKQNLCSISKTLVFSYMFSIWVLGRWKSWKQKISPKCILLLKKKDTTGTCLFSFSSIWNGNQSPWFQNKWCMPNNLWCKKLFKILCWVHFP